MLDDPQYFPPQLVKVFTAQADIGWAGAIEAAKLAYDAGAGSGYSWTYLEASFVTALGHAIFTRIGEAKLLEFIPYSDVMVNPVGREWRITFRSLKRQRSPHGTIYYSRHEPKVTIDGVPKVVGFSRHAIEQTCERIVPTWRNYAGLGDAFAFFSTCVYFEPCVLPSGQRAFTFYEPCDVPGFFLHTYAEQVAGISGEASGCCVRIGYCPADVSGDFFVARTLLPPGFRDTPERALLSRVPLGGPERQHLLELAASNDMPTMIAKHDFTALRFFHENGVPQVVKIGRPIHGSF